MVTETIILLLSIIADVIICVFLYKINLLYMNLCGNSKNPITHFIILTIMDLILFVTFFTGYTDILEIIIKGNGG